MSLVRELLAEMDEAGLLADSSTDAARILQMRLKGLVQQGDPEAGWALDAAANEGLRRDVTAYLKANRTRFRSASGEILSAPSRLGTPVKDQAGRRTGEFQYPLMEEMSRAELESLEQGIGRQMASMGVTIASVRAHLRVLDRYPAAQNVREAMKLAGVDRLEDIG